MSEATFLAGIYAFCVGTMTLVQVLYPNINRRNVILGVGLPAEVLQEEKLKTMVRNYRWTTGIVSLLAGSFFVWYTWKNPYKIGSQTVMLFGLLLLQFLVFLFFHGKIRSWKKEQGYVLTQTKVAVHLELSRDKIRGGGFPWLLYLPAAMIILISTAYLIWAWPSLPARLPTHWNFQGKADAYGSKSIFNVFFTTFLNLFLLGTMMFAHYSVLRMKQQLNPQHTEESFRALQIARGYWNAYFCLMATALIGVLSPMVLMTTGVLRDSQFLLVGTLVVTGFAIAGSISIGMKVGNSGERLKQESLYTDASAEEDDKWILGGTIYYNPEDPAIFVPKRVGIGSTINMGTTFGKVTMVVLLLVIILSVVLPLVVFG